MTDPRETLKQPLGNLNNVLIDRKEMKPLWVFRDEYDGYYTGGKFLCFIGAHYPVGLFAQDAESHEACVERLKSGAWKLGELADRKDPNAKIGWGAGATPSIAFREACHSAGYIKKVIT